LFTDGAHSHQVIILSAVEVKRIIHKRNCSAIFHNGIVLGLSFSQDLVFLGCDRVDLTIGCFVHQVAEEIV
jgi:hypothetical protein